MPGNLVHRAPVSSGDNTMIEFNQVNGKVELDWGATDKPHYQYLANFSFPNLTNWYFIAVTVQAQTGCGVELHAGGEDLGWRRGDPGDAERT